MLAVSRIRATGAAASKSVSSGAAAGQSVLVLNAGSSSLKFMVSRPDDTIRGQIENIGTPGCRMLLGAPGGPKTKLPDYNMGAALSEALKQLPLDDIGAVGHRIVHGGTHFSGPELVTPEAVRKIESLVPLAPLHNPGGLAGISAALEALPHLKDRNVACFDTAFHTTMHPHCYTYAVPWKLAKELGIRRYGFHGLSVEYVFQKVCAEMSWNPATAHVLVCHLGAGCSATAVHDGRSVDTSMGLTPLDGLVMGTRAGSVDPGLFSYIAANTDLSEAEITHVLNKESGLKGISGVTSDMRQILDFARTAPEQEVRERCALARDVFVHRVCQTIATLWVDVARLDALVFTGGVGENSAEIRRRVVDKWGYRGMMLDEELNETPGVEGVISKERSSTQVIVIKTNEEEMIAKHTRNLLGMEV